MALARRDRDRGLVAEHLAAAPSSALRDCVGLTLPGMIDEPGSFSGKINSPRPERGPEPSRRMSLAILKRPGGDAS